MLDHGAHETIDHTREDVIAALAGRGDQAPLVLVDLINQGEKLVRSAQALHPKGRLVSTLFGPGPEAFASREVRYVRLSPQPGQLEHLLQSVEAGWLRPYVSQTFAFDQTPLAYAALAVGHVRGKLVVKVEPRP
jgi:NADPH:quinone reductase